ncbi:MAG: pilus assembly protein [Anaerolineales bacterium]|nr:pilus assembly protein [Anaerolineales bacterium]
MDNERGQTTIFFTLILTGLLLLTAVGIEIGRIVYARGEVGKAADAAALAAVAQVDVSYYRETGQVRFKPNVYEMAQEYASRNSTYLQSRLIEVTVTDIFVDQNKHMVFVTVSADLSSLLPKILTFDGVYSITGYAEVRLQGK